MKNISITKKGSSIEVYSKVLELHPILNEPIKITKFFSKSIPVQRISINEWFEKHF